MTFISFHGMTFYALYIDKLRSCVGVGVGSLHDTELHLLVENCNIYRCQSSIYIKSNMLHVDTVKRFLGYKKHGH